MNNVRVFIKVLHKERTTNKPDAYIAERLKEDCSYGFVHYLLLPGRINSLINSLLATAERQDAHVDKLNIFL